MIVSKVVRKIPAQPWLQVKVAFQAGTREDDSNVLQILRQVERDIRLYSMDDEDDEEPGWTDYGWSHDQGLFVRTYLVAYKGRRLQLR